MRRLIRSDSNKRGTNSVSSQYTSRRSRTLRLGLERLEERRVLASEFLQTFGGTGNDSQYFYDGQAIDPVGNVYQSGAFEQTAYFGPNSATSLISNGGSDAFAAKYTADGTLVWARSLGGTGTDSPGGTAYASEGGVGYFYVAGSFEGSVNFGNGVTLTSAGGSDAFIAKLNANTGETLFAKRIGSTTGNEGAWGLAIANNQVIVSGSFNKTLDFDPGTGTAFRTPAGSGKNLSNDAFILQLNSAGDYVSVYQFGGRDQDYVKSLVVDATPTGISIYIHGSLGVNSSTADLDPGSGIKNAKGTFLAKYFLPSNALPSSTSYWSPVWVDSLGFSVSGYTRSTITGASSLYWLGGFTGTQDFDPGLGTRNLTADAGLGYAFVAKYNKSDGALVWARQYGGQVSLSGIAVQSVDPSDNTQMIDTTLYISTLMTTASFDFNPGLPGGEVTSNGAGSYGVLLGLDANGAYKDVWKMGGTTSMDNLRNSVFGSVGTMVYVAGYFSGKASFPIGGTKTSAGDRDIFLMALDTAPPPALASISTAAGSTKSSTVERSTVDAALLSLLQNDLDDLVVKLKRKKAA